MIYETDHDDYLVHYGIIGMKWGIRRFQNPDGSLTPEGMARYYGKHETDKFASQLRGLPAIYLRSGKATRLANSLQMKAIASQVRKDWETAHHFEKKRSQIINSFYKRKDYEDWVRKTAESDWKERNKDGRLEKSGWTLEGFINWYLYDDGDQGYTLQNWAANSKDKQAKEFRECEKQWIESTKAYNSNCKKAVQAFMGDHGNETYEVKTRWGNNVTSHQRDLADRGADIVSRIMNTWDTYGDDFDSPVPIETYMKLVN